MKKNTVNTFRKMKAEGNKIVMITSYDAVTAAMAHAAGADLLLVGDSMANAILGYPNTIALSLEESMFHVQAVRRGAPEAFVIADMPFMTFQNSMEKALDNAAAYLQKCGADAVKIEGGLQILPVMQRMVECGIPVMAHIGLLPQKVLTSGGYKLSGKTEDDAKRLMEEALAVQEAGAFSVVLECMPEAIGKMISEKLDIPTIGIGGGRFCDGQVQVITDVLGIGSFLPKHAKRYAECGDIMRNAIKNYVDDVKNGNFPEENNCF